MILCKVLKIQSLASGSKGNSVYIASDTTQILVDVGLNLAQLKKRLASAEIDPEKISAVLVTHEHIDHILGLENFIKRYNTPLFIHDKVTDIFRNIPKEQIHCFCNPFIIGDISVNFFPVSHDSKFCFGYTFEKAGAKISLATDLGRVTEDILSNMNHSQIVMLECNHDLLRLTYNKHYPLVLKQRITGSHGHLSNPACALAVYRLAQMGVGQVILAHLSQENNSPSLAYEFVKDFLAKKGIIEGKDIWIDIATQDKATVPFHVEHS